MILDAISYPSGAAVSVSVYVPSGRLLISVASFPDSNVIVLLSSETLALVPSVLSVVNVTFSDVVFPSASSVFPVSVKVAPSSSAPPPTACLLILVRQSSLYQERHLQLLRIFQMVSIHFMRKQHLRVM